MQSNISFYQFKHDAIFLKNVPSNNRDLYEYWCRNILKALCSIFRYSNKLRTFVDRLSTEKLHRRKVSNYTRIFVFTVVSGLSYCHFAFILDNFLSKLVKSSFYISPPQKFLFNSFFQFGIHNFHAA